MLVAASISAQAWKLQKACACASGLVAPPARLDYLTPIMMEALLLNVHDVNANNFCIDTVLIDISIVKSINQLLTNTMTQ